MPTRLIALALLALACSAKPPPEPCAVAAPSKRPWAMRMGERDVTVRWESNEKGCVELGVTAEAAGAVQRVAAGTATEVTVTTEYDFGARPPDKAGTYVMNEVKVDGLEPGTCYTYTLTGADKAGGRFCTARLPGQTVKFMAIGDTAVRWGHTAMLLPKLLDPKPDFVVHVGDIQYYSALTETWANWFPQAAPMLAAAAFLPCIGNHELELPGELDDYYLRLFASPGRSGTPRWYRFQSGGVHFFSLDTESSFAPGSEQVAWLTAELAAAKAEPGFRYSILYFHKPAWTLSNHAPQLAVRAALEPLLAPNQVRLVLQGHNHEYERFEVRGVTWVVTGGGGAPLYGTDDNVSSFPDDVPFRKKAVAAYQGMLIEAGDVIVGRAIDEAGTEIDRFELQ